MDSFAQTELSAILYKWSKKALFKEVLSDKHTIFWVKAGIVDFYLQQVHQVCAIVLPKMYESVRALICHSLQLPQAALKL